ncbi:hypothetical protein ACVWXU_003772 [Streptomyces sp. TE33382]
MSAAPSNAIIVILWVMMWSGCGYPPFSSYVVMTCGRKARIFDTRRPAAVSSSSSAKQPSGSGGSGSPSGSPESTKPSHSCLTPRISLASSISFLRTSWMFSSMYASPWSFGLRMEPRSPPVQVTTSTSTPSDTYLAIVAAPLLDSSSGWA